MRRELRIARPGLGDYMVAWRTDVDISNGEALEEDEVDEEKARQTFNSIVGSGAALFDCSCQGEPVQIAEFSQELSCVVAVRPIVGGCYVICVDK